MQYLFFSINSGVKNDFFSVRFIQIMPQFDQNPLCFAVCNLHLARFEICIRVTHFLCHCSIRFH